MEEDRAANQQSEFSLSFTLALYTSNEFGLSHNNSLDFVQLEMTVGKFSVDKFVIKLER